MHVLRLLSRLVLVGLVWVGLGFLSGIRRCGSIGGGGKGEGGREVCGWMANVGRDLIDGWLWWMWMRM